jgi:hypothetical protein
VSLNGRFRAEGCQAERVKSRARVRAGWLTTALTAALLCVVLVFGFQTGSCIDFVDAGSSTCSQGPEPFALLLGLASAVFVIFALARAFRRK